MVIFKRFSNIQEFTEIQENCEKKIEGKGFERFVGSKGSQLSGGQKQRIAIARVLIKEPKIYLFDEATSALDSKSETIVQDALNNICDKNTCITIAHRLSAITKVDRIFVIKDGQIIEEGNFDGLNAMKGYFHAMVN